jgi:hypothetical protein
MAVFPTALDLLPADSGTIITFLVKEISDDPDPVDVDATGYLTVQQQVTAFTVAGASLLGARSGVFDSDFYPEGFDMSDVPPSPSSRKDFTFADAVKFYEDMQDTILDRQDIKANSAGVSTPPATTPAPATPATPPASTTPSTSGA